MPSLYSDIIDNDALWTQPNLDHAAALAVVGIAATTNADDTRLALTDINVRTPTVLAFTLDNEPESIYCGYNPTLYPADLGNATPFDNKMMVFVGDNLNTAIPVVLENVSTRRSNAAAAYNIAYITGPNGHGANPDPVLRFNHAAVGAAETDELRARPLFLLPKDDGLTMLRACGASGKMSFMRFFTDPEPKTHQS